VRSAANRIMLICCEYKWTELLRICSVSDFGAEAWVSVRTGTVSKIMS